MPAAEPGHLIEIGNDMSSMPYAPRGRRGPVRSTVLASASAVLLLTLTACGGSDDPVARTEVPGSTADADVSAVQEQFDVPEDCRDTFPDQLAPADLADVTLWPENFPEPPVAAILCQAEESVDGATGTVGYATDVPSAQVLDTYRAALAPYTLHTGGGSDQIKGTTDEGTLFSVTAPEGTIRLAFAKE